MASDDASRAAGMWSSVLMCAGIAGDGSGSCTLRSNICDEAGECRPGEDERLMRRLGEALMPAGYMRGLLRGERRSDGGDVVRGGDGSSVGAPVGDILSACCESPSFFFPRPSSLRLPFARSPDCSSPTLLSSSTGDVAAGTCSVVFMAVNEAYLRDSYAQCFLLSKTTWTGSLRGRCEIACGLQYPETAQSGADQPWRLSGSNLLQVLIEG